MLSNKRMGQSKSGNKKKLTSQKLRPDLVIRRLKSKKKIYRKPG